MHLVSDAPTHQRANLAESIVNMLFPGSNIHPISHPEPMARLHCKTIYISGFGNECNAVTGGIYINDKLQRGYYRSSECQNSTHKTIDVAVRNSAI